MLIYVLFIIGFFLLIKGADWLVDGASALAKQYGISSLVIGLTIVAFGTSAPELLINTVAAYKGSSSIALGNIIGSNILNILLGLGVLAILHSIKVKHSITWREIPFALLSVIVLAVLANKAVIFNKAANSMHRVDGIIMLLFFSVFLYYLYQSAKFNKTKGNDDIKSEPLWKSIIMIFAGIFGLYYGGEFVVSGAIVIAQFFGLSEFLISVTIIAVGTSLPELAASIAAARKGDADLTIGTIVGTNIFNIFLVLGITSVISPLAIPSFINFDLFFLFIATFLLFLFMFIGKKHKLEKWQGVLFIMVYVFYIYTLIQRG